MPADTDLMSLYSGKILELAADIPHLGQLDEPDVRIKRRAPLCGSNVTIDIKFSKGRISEFRQDVKACALGQAAASVIGANVDGLDATGAMQMRDQLAAMLKAGGPVPDAPFDGLEVLRPAQDYKNRHASVLLVAEALVDAFAQADA